jgi:hypothetical protein
VLPDEVGACSVADGAGLLQVNEARKKTHDAIEAYMVNELSHDMIRDKLWSLIRKEYGEAWVSEVYDDVLIYELGGKLYRLSYSMDGEEPKLGSDPEKVDRVVEYRPATTTANSQGSTGDTEMTKAQMVDALIANKASGFDEKDKTTLLAFSDEKVKTLHANAEKATKAPEKKEGEGDGKKPVEEPAQGAAADPPTQTGAGQSGVTRSPEGTVADDAIKKMENNMAKKPQTVDEFLASAPAPIRRMVANSMRVEQQTRARLINTIVANAGESFTEEDLKANGADGEPKYSTELLERLAGMATKGSAAQAGGQSYAGAGFPSQEEFEVNAAGDDDGLDLPSTAPTVNEEA